MPTELELSFKKWWTTVQPSDTLDVRYPHQKHGNALKTSHSAKTRVMDRFLEFVDMNTQPNGRSADSSGPTHYFLPKFTTIQTPKPGVSHYSERLVRSVVGEFNRVQQESGEGTNGSSHNWLKAHRQKVAIVHIRKITVTPALAERLRFMQSRQRLTICCNRVWLIQMM
jgi:hypothetical protein